MLTILAAAGTYSETYLTPAGQELAGKIIADAIAILVGLVIAKVFWWLVTRKWRKVDMQHGAQGREV